MRQAGTMAARAAIVVVGIVLGACAAAPPREEPAAVAEPVSAPAPFAVRFPVSLAERPTTSADIYLGNLDASIAEYERRLAAGPDARAEASLAGKLYHRFRVLGRLADGERALALLDAALAPGREQHPADAADAHLLRAIVLQAFHRFADAEADLARARELGAPAARVAAVQRDVDLALGRYERLRGDFAQALQPSADYEEAAFRAHLLLLQGDLAGAGVQLHRAQEVYVDVNPVPLAWLHTQYGIALLDHDDCAGAVPFFDAALERLPSYYLALEHRAECAATLGDVDGARARYGAVIAQTGNPEFVGALAGVELAAGNVAQARRLVAKARGSYDALLAKHRAAYVQHAAEFHLEHGKPRRALLLATENIALRQDVGSRVLLARAYAHAGFAKEACDERAKALATGLRPAVSKDLDAVRCP